MTQTNDSTITETANAVINGVDESQSQTTIAWVEGHLDVLVDALRSVADQIGPYDYCSGVDVGDGVVTDVWAEDGSWRLHVYQAEVQS